MLTKNNRALIFITLTILICLIIGIIFHQAPKEETKAPDTPPPTVHKKITNDQDPVMGNSNAKQHIVVFEDMKCSACKYYSNKIFPTLKRKLIDTDKADYTLILLAFINGSKPAGNAAYCINDQSTKQFFEFVEYVYAHQPQESLDWATKETLLEFASHIDGVDLNALGTCIDDQTHYSKLDDNLQLAGKLTNNQIRTPTILVDGTILPLNNTSISNLLNQ